MPKYHLPAEEVRRIRRSLGETQAEFAQRLVVDAVTVARWETDQRKCTGLYAKTIVELAPGNNMSNKDVDMEDEQEIRSVGLDQFFRLTNKLPLILKFLYKEVPLKQRKAVLESYQEWFECWAYGNSLFENVCHEQLVREIGYFIRPIIPGPVHPTEPGNYAAEKLYNAHAILHEIAKDLAPNSDFAQKDTSQSKLCPRERYSLIQLILDDLLSQPNLKEGDIALLKLYRTLLNFAKEEMTSGKAQPIPAAVSFAFAEFLAATFSGLITILVPRYDEHRQLDNLEDAIKGFA